MPPVVRPEGVGLPAGLADVAQPPRQGAFPVRSAGDHVGLLVGEYLELVLHVAKEPVGGAQRLALGRRHVAVPGQLRQGVQRVSLAEPRVVAAVHELQGLGKELDLADAPVPELEIPLPAVAVGELLPLDARLHVAQLLHRGKVQVTAVDEQPHVVQERLAQLQVPGHGPRLDQGRPLPALAPGLVVEEGRGHRLRRRPLAPHRPKPQVGAEHQAVLGHLAHCMGQAFRELAEEFRGRDDAAACRLIGLVEVDEVDVRAEVELPSAELAHAEHDEAVVPRGARKPHPAVPPFQVRPAEPAGRVQREVRQGRQLPHGFLHRRQRPEVAGADAQELPPLVKPKPAVEPRRGLLPGDPAERRGMAGGRPGSRPYRLGEGLRP